MTHPLLEESSSDPEPEEEAEVAELTEVNSQKARKYWILGGTVFISFIFLSTITLWHFYGLAIWEPVVAIIISAPLAYLATRFGS